ncbi:MAG: hypothetical protein DME64_10460 [Verrucomicrobia bacterium]|nr:MAG: hypothetical protein DME64_10460 [Verrucomicrobiota bacterium]
MSFRVFRGLEVQRLNFRSLGIHLSTKEAKTHQNFGGDDQLRYFFLCHFVCFVDKSDRMSTGKQRFSTSQCLLKAAETAALQSTSWEIRVSRAIRASK